jgi:ribosomal protein uL23
MVEEKTKDMKSKAKVDSKFKVKTDVTTESKVHEEADPYQVIKYPLSTEKSIRQIEFDNKLVFVVHPRATKLDVKKSVEELFKVKVAKVNIQNSFTGQKKAYVKLTGDSLASDVSADLGLI